MGKKLLILQWEDILIKCKITEVVLVHWNMVNNNYQQSSRILYPDKSFGQLLNISP